MPTVNNMSAFTAALSIGAGLAMMQRTLEACERERIRLGIDSDEYAWRVISAAAGSISSAVFFLSALVHAADVSKSVESVN